MAKDYCPQCREPMTEDPRCVFCGYASLSCGAPRRTRETCEHVEVVMSGRTGSLWCSECGNKVPPQSLAERLIVDAFRPPLTPRELGDAMRGAHAPSMTSVQGPSR